MLAIILADRGVEHCDESVCLSVCVCVCVCVCVFVCPRSYLRHYTPDLQFFFMRVAYGGGSVLLLQRSDTLCTPGFMDDVIFVLDYVHPATLRRPSQVWSTSSTVDEFC